MGKLRLDLDQLRVESFATDERGRERGTVKGNAELGDGMLQPGVKMPTLQTCMIDLCGDSWISTCAGTCGETCQNTFITCNTCFGGDSCFGGATCMTGCLATCPTGDVVCCV